MPSSTKRNSQISALIQRQVATLLQHYSREPSFCKIVVTDIELSNDYSSAKVFFTLIDKDYIEKMITLLKKEAPNLRKALARSINLRYVPQIRFIYDYSIERGERLSKLINELKKK